MKKHILLYSLLSIISGLFNVLLSQDISKTLNSSKKLEDKMAVVLELAENHGHKNVDSAIYYFNIYDSLANLSANTKLKMASLTNLSKIHGQAGNTAKALEYCYELIEVAKRTNKHEYIAEALVNLAGFYEFIKNTDKTFYYYKEAIKEAKLCKEKTVLLMVYQNGENFFFNNQQFTETKNILIEEAKIDPSLKEDSRYWSDFGDIFRALEQLDSADLYYKKAIAIAELSKDTFLIIQQYFNYSLIPRELKKYDVAIEYYKKGIDLSVKLKNQGRINWGLDQLSQAYFEKGDYKNAKECVQKLINEQKDIKGLEKRMARFYRVMSEIDEKLKNYEEAYSNLLVSYELNDEVNYLEKEQQLGKVEENNIKKEKQLEIDSEKKQKETEKKIKNISFIALGISIVLIIIVIISLFRVNKAKKNISLQKLETDKQKHLVEEKQKEILDSINYAKRIQQAHMPTEKYITKNIDRLKK